MLLLCLLIGIQRVFSQDEIFLNPGFEDPFDGDDWYCVGCDLTQDIDAYSGTYSGRASNRQDYQSVISQNVSLEADIYYYFSIHVKLGDMADGAMWHQVDLYVQLQLDDGTTEDIWVARLPYLRLDQNWQKIGGDFYLDDRGATAFRAYILVNVNNEPAVDYLVDEASLTAFYFNPNWKEEANARIEEIRKNDVTLDVSISGDYDPANIEIQVRQVNKSFAFGSAVQDAQISGDTDYNKRYQDTFYSNYNWAVLENALKWRRMGPSPEEIIYPDESIRRLRDRGIPQRGHTVFWGKRGLNPNWLKLLSPEELLEEMIRRLDYLVPRYVGQLEHWDVNNEQEHGAWYEEKLGDPLLMNTMFDEVRARDNYTKLFLNDYHIINDGLHTQSVVNRALEVNAATGKCDGIGVQSHIQGYPLLTRIQRQLEVASTAGIPLWITELDIEIVDEEERANGYDDLVTLYYSIPAVDGILLWGFSDLHHWRPDAALFDGEFFEANAAGLRWQQMMFERWVSSETFYPETSEETFGFRGFHGQYQIQISNNGEVIKMQEFNLIVGEDISVDVEIN